MYETLKEKKHTQISFLLSYTSLAKMLVSKCCENYVITLINLKVIREEQPNRKTETMLKKLLLFLSVTNRHIATAITLVIQFVSFFIHFLKS